MTVSKILLPLILVLSGCKAGATATAVTASPSPLVTSSPVACTYYVSPQGADTNPGAEALPFKTIGQGSKALASQAGGMVCVQDGVYPESLLVRSSGTASKWVVFKSVHHRGAKITGLVGSQNPVIAINERSFVEVNGFDVSGGPGFGIYTGYLTGGHHT